jgi:hypothetical protein
VYQWYIDLWHFKILSGRIINKNKKVELIKWLKDQNVEEQNKEELGILLIKL